MTSEHPNANGWEVIPAGATTGTTPSGEPRCRRFIIPNTQKSFVWLRDGAAGLIIADLCVSLNLFVEKMNTGILDDWGYSLRPIAGTDTWSIHAYANAVDYNAPKHPQHKRGTFTKFQTWKIRRLLKRRYKGCITWGGDWSNAFVDEMHFELNVSQPDARDLALSLMQTRRGKRVLHWNPGLAKVIKP